MNETENKVSYKEQIYEKIFISKGITKNYLFNEINNPFDYDIEKGTFFPVETPEVDNTQLECILQELITERKIIISEELTAKNNELTYIINTVTKYIYNDLHKKRIHIADKELVFDGGVVIKSIEENDFTHNFGVDKTYLINLKSIGVIDYRIVYGRINRGKYTKYINGKCSEDINKRLYYNSGNNSTYNLMYILYEEKISPIRDFLIDRMDEFNSLKIVADYLDKLIEFTKENVEYINDEPNAMCEIMEEAKLSNCSLKEFKYDRKPRRSKLDYPEGLTTKQKMVFYQKFRYHNDPTYAINQTISLLKRNIKKHKQNKNAHSKYWLEYAIKRLAEQESKLKELKNNEHR